MAAMTALALGATIAGTVMNSVGQIRQGRAQKGAAYSEAERAEKNAAYAELQARDATARGREEEGYLRQNVRQVIGQQRAGFAGQGVVVDQDTAGAVVADTAREGELDALRVRSNAAREALGFQVQAEDLRDQARIARKAGDNAMTAAKWGVANTIIGGASSLMQQRWGWDKGAKIGASGRTRPLLANRGGTRIAGLSGAYGGGQV
jgi:hypothetical protein